MKKNLYSVVLLAGLTLLPMPAHALDLGGLEGIVSGIGQTACQQSAYPTFASFESRRKVITSDKKMQMLHCLPGAPYGALCSTFIGMMTMDKNSYIQKMLVDTTFWVQSVNIYINWIMAGSPTAAEKKAGIFYQYLLTRAQQVDQVLTSGQQVDTVFVGDSLMHIFERYGEGQFNNAVFVGIAGDRTDSDLFRLVNNVGRMHPKNVVISISGNDVLQSCAEKDIISRRAQIVQLLQSVGVQNIYWLSLPPLRDSIMNAKIPRANAQIAVQPGIVYVDTHTPMLGANGKIKPEYDGDGIHFNERAYREVWIPKLKSFGL